MMNMYLFLLGVAVLAHGKVRNERIVGGQSVSIYDYPYQVSVRYLDQHVCGGSILDKTTVVTAAHCVYSMDSKDFSVRVGSTKHANGELHLLKSIITHENFDESSANNDVAILKLATPLTFSLCVQPIELQNPGVEVPAGSTAWVSGWGAIDEEGKHFPALLRAVDVQVITNHQCNLMYSPVKITEQMLCAYTLHHDACERDSGGPLVYNGKLIGIVSWGNGCANPKYPGVYSNVSNLYSWIIENKN